SSESLRLECFIKCKGVLRGGAEVAVKRISQENDGVREFLAEISSLGRLKQRNLVALRGWCKKDMGNFLIRNIKGVAFAVLYLHEGWEEQVLHRDIKASNVLLDKDMNGKLGDFGLARMHSHRQVASTTKLVGTVGYMAPEVIKTGQASTRTDVYMFGILILEVMCGRRPMEEGKPPLVEFVWGPMVKGELMNALDERLSAKGDFNLQQVEKVLQLGLLCAYPEPKSRPNMRQVVSILEGNNEGGEESENENADTCLLLKLKSEDIFSEYPRDGKLFVNVVSVESGKAIAKSSKVLVQNGSCQWSDKHIEIINTYKDIKKASAGASWKRVSSLPLRKACISPRPKRLGLPMGPCLVSFNSILASSLSALFAARLMRFLQCSRMMLLRMMLKNDA
ncbi:hypothetical protein S83_042189, partial [Arachis hypogaea]